MSRMELLIMNLPETGFSRMQVTVEIIE
jgi:hypothetical protein